MIRGFRFTNQLANAEVDARIHQELLNKNDGIFYGMNLSKTTNSITISEGLCEIAGRPVAVIGSETIQTSTNSLYCVLVLEIDLSKESTKDTFEQVNFKILTSSNNYTNVTQQDINIYSGTNKIYQLEFARFRTGTNGITDFKDTRKFLSFTGMYAQIKEECEEIINQIKNELVYVKDGSSYFLKASELTNQKLDGYTAEGFYYALGGNKVENKPDGADFFGLYVMRTGGSLRTQLLVTSTNIYMRTFEGGTWNEWRNMTEQKIFTLAGNVTINPGTTETISLNYPAGLTMENCVPISCGVKGINEGYNYVPGDFQNTYDLYYGGCKRTLALLPSNIQLRIESPFSAAGDSKWEQVMGQLTSNKYFSYKVVLMKIG